MRKSHSVLCHVWKVSHPIVQCIHTIIQFPTVSHLVVLVIRSTFVVLKFFNTEVVFKCPSFYLIISPKKASDQDSREGKLCAILFP